MAGKNYDDGVKHFFGSPLRPANAKVGIAEPERN